ncbi:MAG: hypothetical protein KKG92_03125, partial [Gammaproteobacteria bacterium]|nr:hypothetical protein [Gammaproteobacteria bacterium]
LNTHLDTTIALARYSQVCKEPSYRTLVESARKATNAIMALDSANWLYKLLFRAINLTLLPSAQARRLPLYKRAIKRLAWKYHTPNFYRIKAIFPRLVMPGGYIDRNLALGSFAFHYLPINLMDLARHRRHFQDTGMDAPIARLARFIQESGVRGRWRELAYERYALGFWAEALWQLCQIYDDWCYRAWLAEAVLDLEDEAMGIPPSLLGGNREALAWPRACPPPPEPGVRVLSIPREREWEVLWVNTLARVATVPAWQATQWLDTSGQSIPPPAQLPARQFVVARGALGSEN